MKPFLFLGLVAVALTSCDPVIDCECASPDITVQYQSDSLSCISDFRDFVNLTSFDVSTNDTIEAYEYFNSWECKVIFYPKGGRYYVISSDSLNIWDTIYLSDITYGSASSSNVRCECPPPITSATIEINGETFTGKEVTRNY